MTNLGSLFISVAYSVMLPIFLLIGLGFLLGRVFRLDAGTMNKLNLYALAPALIFSKLLHSTLTLADAGRIAIFVLALSVLLLLVSSLACAILRVKRGNRPAVKMASMFANTGNYGIPAAQLAFGPAGVAVQAVVIAAQDLVFFSLGMFVAGGGMARARKALGTMFRYPFLYAIALALALRGTETGFPAPLDSAIGYLSDGLVPVALLTLGAQLASSSAPPFGRELGIASVIRLAVAPLVALLLAPLLGFDRTTAMVLFVGASFPVAVNTALIAIEFRRGAVLASSVVVFTTLLSALTVTLVVALSRM